MKKPQNRSSTTTSAPNTTFKQYRKENEQVEELRRTAETLSRQLSKAKFQLADVSRLKSDNEALQSRVDLLERIDCIVPEPPKWTQPKASKGALHQGMPSLLLSDSHWDEIVKLEEVEGVNKYDREIAILRLKKTLSGTIDVLRNYFSGLKYEGMTLLLGGDHFSGNIHEELQQTNEDTIYGSLDFWSDQLAAFIGSLADEFGKLHIAGVVGNHGRNTRKPRAKLRVRDNLDWLLFRIVARAFKDDPRITWQIPESADCNVKLYNTTYRLTHGDQFRGGSGIAGMLSPLMLGSYRKTRRQMTLKNLFEWLVICHWHQYWVGKGIIVNGSLKGYDEYSYLSNFDFERPTQAVWVTTPENGMTFPAGIFADDRCAEGW